MVWGVAGVLVAWYVGVAMGIGMPLLWYQLRDETRWDVLRRYLEMTLRELAWAYFLWRQYGLWGNLRNGPG